MPRSTTRMRVRCCAWGRPLAGFSLLLLVPSAPVYAQTTVLYRVNAGGPQVPAADGTLPAWSADTITDPSPYANHAGTGNTTGSSTAPISSSPLIPAAAPDELFQTERWDDAGAAELQWDFPIAAGTEVLVRLYFAEIWTGITGPGQRLFNVALEGQTVITGLDMYGEVGPYAALMKWYIVTVGADGNLDIDFLHGAVQNPALKGLEILSGPGIVAAAVDSASQRAYQQLDIDPPGYPINTNPLGAWVTTGPENWTSGFFPGALWRCYAGSADPSWLDLTEPWTAGLVDQQYLTAHQDIGFMIYCSYGEGFRLTSRPAYRTVLTTAAGSLAQRYNPTVGCIRASGNKNATTGEYRVIIDGMMTLELLLRATHLGGAPAWRAMAISHAQRSADWLIRPDGGSYQEVFFDTATGNFVRHGTFNGYNVNSTWSRGQAWGIHGFTTVYRETGDAAFLDAASRMADYFIAHAPADHVPPWDFGAPGPNPARDSSAAAITAAGLFELSHLTDDPVDRLAYWTAGRDILKSICTDAYLSNGVASAGTLLHGTYNLNFNQAVDASLIWGDYYLLQAISRYRQYLNPAGDCVTSLPTWQHGDLATVDGLRLVQFDVTPTGGAIDGLIALAQGASDDVADYAAVVRFGPAGVMEARNGDAFTADAVVSYQAGERYIVNLAVDLASHIYNAEVVSPAGVTQRLAGDYAFGSHQLAATVLDTWATTAATGAHELCNLRSFAVGGADANGDDDVDLADYQALQACVGQPLPAHPECQGLDLDGSGTVDAADAVPFAACLAGPGNPSLCGG